MMWTADGVTAGERDADDVIFPGIDASMVTVMGRIARIPYPADGRGALVQLTAESPRSRLPSPTTGTATTDTSAQEALEHRGDDHRRGHRLLHHTRDHAKAACA